MQNIKRKTSLLFLCKAQGYICLRHTIIVLSPTAIIDSRDYHLPYSHSLKLYTGNNSPSVLHIGTLLRYIRLNTTDLYLLYCFY